MSQRSARLRLLLGGKWVRISWLRLFWAGLVVVGAAAGYLVSSGQGHRLLHREIETQLTRLLDGPVTLGEVELHFDPAFRVEARALEAYPAADPHTPAALRARRIIASVDLLALLIGRLELSELVLEAPHLRVVQDANGAFPHLPLPPLALAPVEVDRDAASENLLGRLDGLEAQVATFFEGLRASDRVEIQDGTIHWIRPTRLDPDAPQREIRLELVNSTLERGWLSDSVTLDWSAVFVDGEHAPFPFEGSVHHADDAPFEWSVFLSQIPLDAAETPLSFVEGIDGLSGSLTSQIHFIGGEGASRLSIEGRVDDAEITLRKSGTILRRDRVEVEGVFEIHRTHVQLAQGTIEGDRFTIDMESTIERPVRPSARARFEARMVGVEVANIFELARSLEGESTMALSISRVAEHIEKGRIISVHGAGNARLQLWDELLSGRITELPAGFLIGANFEGISIDTGQDAPIEDLRGEVEWTTDQLTLRDTTARFRGTQLPEINVVLDGFSHLVRAPEEARTITAQPPPIPGFAPFLELLKPRDPNSLPPVAALGLAIDRLEHPVFRWPFSNLRVLLEPLRRGIQIKVRGGVWGGASVTGDLAWFNDVDAPTLSANLQLRPLDTEGPTSPDAIAAAQEDAAAPSSVAGTAGDPAPEPEIAAAAAPTIPPSRWGSGRFEIEFRPRPHLPFRAATGYFRLDGSNLVGNDVSFAIDPEGEIAARIVLDLGREGEVGANLSFASTQARLQHVSSFIALPAGFARGQFSASGSFEGWLDPDEPLFDRLDGRVQIEVENGAVRSEIPLMLRFAKATEGYNPFAKEDELKYETLKATIDFEQGRISTEDFEIEGPLRVYVKGEIDTRAEPSQINAVVGIFMFRTSGELLDTLPLVKYFLPGSGRGLVGAYLRAEGPVASPEVKTLPLETLMSTVPSALKAPFKVLGFLFKSEEDAS